MIKKPSFFDNIAKSLVFEADEDKQKDNDINGSTKSAADANLDKELNSLKSDNGENNDDQINSGNPPDSPDSNTAQNNGEDSGMPESDSGESFGENQEDESGTEEDPSESEHKSNGAPRKLTLYAEFNRIHNVLKESIDAVNQRSTDNNNLKSCVAQLQEILTDVRFILSNFTDRSEEDIMVQFQLAKKRTSLVLELLKRETDNKENS